MIAEFVARGMKILVTCPSNAAVDVLLERVAKMGINIRRLGHPVRTSPHLRQLTMDAKLKQNQVLDELKTEMYQAKGRERGELRKGNKLSRLCTLIKFERPLFNWCQSFVLAKKKYAKRPWKVRMSSLQHALLWVTVQFSIYLKLPTLTLPS